MTRLSCFHSYKTITFLIAGKQAEAMNGNKHNCLCLRKINIIFKSILENQSKWDFRSGQLTSLLKLKCRLLSLVDNSEYFNRDYFFFLQCENDSENVTTIKSVFVFVCYCFLGVWYLNAEIGKNIQLHFQVFDVEYIYDTVEVRDGRGTNSSLLGK